MDDRVILHLLELHQMWKYFLFFCFFVRNIRSKRAYHRLFVISFYFFHRNEFKLRMQKVHELDSKRKSFWYVDTLIVPNITRYCYLKEKKKTAFLVGWIPYCQLNYYYSFENYICTSHFIILPFHRADGREWWTTSGEWSVCHIILQFFSFFLFYFLISIK